MEDNTERGNMNNKDLEELMDSLFKDNGHGDKTLEHFFKANPNYVPVEGGIKDKIKSGYLYQIGTPSGMVVCTGYGGVINYIDQCRASGLPDDMIAESISITDSEGLMTNTVWTPIKDITWKQK